MNLRAGGLNFALILFLSLPAFSRVDPAFRSRTDKDDYKVILTHFFKILKLERDGSISTLPDYRDFRIDLKQRLSFRPILGNKKSAYISQKRKSSFSGGPVTCNGYRKITIYFQKLNSRKKAVAAKFKQATQIKLVANYTKCKKSTGKGTFNKTYIKVYKDRPLFKKWIFKFKKHNL